jgi:hypothetical protein
MFASVRGADQVGRSGLALSRGATERGVTSTSVACAKRAHGAGGAFTMPERIELGSAPSLSCVIC